LINRLDPQLVEECEMHIVGHKIFVRLKDIPMYLSKKTKDSIRNRYSHSVEVGFGTEYLLSNISRQLGEGVNLDFFNIAKIVGMVHDIGHTAFSHDGEVILDRLLRQASSSLKKPITFNANLNNFRRIEKYALFDVLPEDVKKYAFSSLIKRKSELLEYPEYLYLKDDLDKAMQLEEKYLASKGISIQHTSSKTILCQAMDLADENRYRVTDIIDALNIYSKQKLKEILTRSIRSEVRVKDLRKFVEFPVQIKGPIKEKHSDTLKIKKLLILLLNQESHAKTEFQNVMNRISMAFNRNFKLSKKGKLIPISEELEALRSDFQRVASIYIWGSKKVQNIKKPFKHYFTTVAEYFINENYKKEFIDSSSYKKDLLYLEKKILSKKEKREKELLLLRNFLGGLTNYKIIELYKKIKLSECENYLGYDVDKKEKFLAKEPLPIFEKKLEKYKKRMNKYKSA